MAVTRKSLLFAPLVGLALLVGGPSVVAQDEPAPELLEELATEGVLTECVDPSFPPMEFYEEAGAEEPVGFDIDLVTTIAERLGLEIEVIPTEFTGLLPALEAGRCDIVASGIYLTEERLETFDAQPYYDTSVILMTLAENEEIDEPEDLAGKTVSVQAGTNYINILNDLQEELEAAGLEPMTIQTYPKGTDAIQQLIVGRADVTITQDTEAAFRELQQPGQFRIAYVYPDPETFGIYYRPENEALGAALEEVVEALREEGELARLAEEWGLPVEGVEFSVFVAGTPVATPEA